MSPSATTAVWLRKGRHLRSTSSSSWRECRSRARSPNSTPVSASRYRTWSWAGPATYITPDIYLADQVRDEAKALGIETTDDPRWGRFQSGKAILVTYIHKVINGLSVFGVVGDTRQHIEVGSVLVDDTPAWRPGNQFTLTIPRGHAAYNELANLFDDALRDQSPSAVRDLAEDVPGVALRIQGATAS